MIRVETVDGRVHHVRDQDDERREAPCAWQSGAVRRDTSGSYERCGGRWKGGCSISLPARLELCQGYR